MAGRYRAPAVVPDALIGLSGPYDISKVPEAASALMGSDPADDPDAWAEANPVEQAALRPGVPVLLLHGSADDIVAVAFTTQFGEALRNAGFGSPLPGVWVAPSGVPIPEEAASAIRLEVSAEDESGRRLLSESWPLDRTADAYLKFMKAFEPLRTWLARSARLSELEAFTARILLIHQYRRVVLRDPLLPLALLPDDWPGSAARALCGEIYRAVLPASERWLDHHGLNENGVLPVAATELARRFLV